MPKDFGFSPVDYSAYYASLDANSTQEVETDDPALLNMHEWPEESTDGTEPAVEVANHRNKSVFLSLLLFFMVLEPVFYVLGIIQLSMARSM